ncbi:MAG: ABC transporter permease [Bdellovibrionales bacterium]
MTGKSDCWTKVISPQRSWLDLRLGEIWRYRHLVFLFIRRDLRASYKQTVLGWLWLFIPTLISTVVFTVIFGKVAKLSSDGAPHELFYMAGLLMWGFFNASVVGNSNIFSTQAGLFSKVYFPRMIIYLANIGATLFSTGLQMLVFLTMLFYFTVKGVVPGPNWAVLLLPVLLLLSAGIALGVGGIVSSVTAKYRDLSFLLAYGMQLWMYGTAIIYPLSSIPENYRAMAMLNPITSIIETFRYGFIGTGAVPVGGLFYTAIVALLVSALGLVIFNRIEATAMDTI